MSSIGSGTGNGIGSALGLDPVSSGVGGAGAGVGVHLGSLMSGISGSAAYPPFPGTGSAGGGVGTGGGVHAGYHAPVTLPGLGFYSPQLAAQRVMSEGRMGVSAIAQGERPEMDEQEQWDANEDEPQSA